MAKGRKDPSLRTGREGSGCWNRKSVVLGDDWRKHGSPLSSTESTWLSRVGRSARNGGSW